MSRSGYTDDCENLELYRASVERSLRGQRGQAFLMELAKEMDAMPEKILIADEIVDECGDVCALGVVSKARGYDMSHVDVSDPAMLGEIFGISQSMAAEIEYMNDEWKYGETPEQRWSRMRKWVDENLLPENKLATGN